jgi:hypothetical protein
MARSVRPFFANAQRNNNLNTARALLKPTERKTDNEAIASEGSEEKPCPFTCRQCGAPMVVVEILMPQHAPRAPPQRLAA